MQDPLDRYAARCTKQQMKDSDLKEMLLAEQERVDRLQHVNYDRVYLGVHSGTLAVTFSQPRLDPRTDTEFNDGLVRARVTMQKPELWPDAIDWTGDTDCTQLFQATLQRKKDTGNHSDTATLNPIEQEFCFAMQARRWIEETVMYFDLYPVEVVNGCEVVDSFTPDASG
jgi:hypothetical protein